MTVLIANAADPWRQANYVAVRGRPVGNGQPRVVTSNQCARDNQNESGAGGEHRKAVKCRIEGGWIRLQVTPPNAPFYQSYTSG